MKHKSHWILLFVSLFMVMAMTAFTAVQAAPGNPTLEFLLNLLFGLTIAAPGGAALIVVLINIGKMFGWVKDGSSQIAVNVLTVVFALAYGAMSLFGVSLPGVDTSLASLASTLTALLPLLAIIIKWLSPSVYGVMRGVPMLGYSHSFKTG